MSGRHFEIVSGRSAIFFVSKTFIRFSDGGLLYGFDNLSQLSVHEGFLFRKEREVFLKENKNNIYRLTADETQRRFETDFERGLTSQEASARLERHGPNQLKEGKKTPFWKKFLLQFKDFLIIVLLVAAVVSGLLGEVSDMILIMLIVIINAVIGVIQENKAEDAIASLKKMAVSEAKVLRDGRVITVPASTLVPGDIVNLDAGDNIPADGRLIESASLQIQESALTGESVPVDKTTDAIDRDEVPLGDRKNMVFMNSIVTNGRGRFIVTDTGMNTEIGKIAGMINASEPMTTPLQKNIDKLGKTLGIAALVACALIFVIGLLRGGSPLQMFLTAISLAVAAIPEGLPAIVTVVLAMGSTRLAEKNAIIRKLPAVETLGCASVICSDKTGTLTQNRMTIKKVYANEGLIDAEDILDDGFTASEKFVVRIGNLCNDASIVENEEKIIEIGDPTEVAMVAYADNLGFDKNISLQEAPRVAEIPFDSDRKLMTTVHHYQDTWLSFTKGAPDILIDRCDEYLKGYEVLPFDEKAKAEVRRINNELAENAYRVLGYAFNQYAEQPETTQEKVENHLIFAGLTGMIDPPREEVGDAISECHSAGIETVMITGDHKVTAVAIAKELGIYGENSQALSGIELDAMSDEEFDNVIERTNVYARVSPENKVRIVESWQRKGKVVAMTGDGVNDAPALKKADIGCAMGITGTDVTKEASEMILTDDKFSTIVSAVKEGRRIYANIRKAVHFLLSCNIAEILTLFIATVLGWVQPLLPVHILWINLVTDSLPALALGMEKAEDDIMKYPPRKASDSIFADGYGVRMILQGIMLAIISLLVFNYGLNKYGIEEARTMIFAVLGLSQLVHVFNVRSAYGSVFSRNLFTNRYLWGAIAISVAMQLIVIFVPALHPFFNVTTMNMSEWGVIIAAALAPLVIVEIMKFIERAFLKK